MNKGLNILKILLLGCGLCLVLGSAWAGPIKLGLLAPITGPNPDWGKKQVIAVNMAVARVNARGGVGGRMLEPVIYDTGGDPEQAISLYQRLSREDGALAVIGPFFSSVCEQVFPRSTEEEVVVISPASSKPGLCDLRTQPYAFRANVPSSVKERYLLKRWQREKDIHSVVVVSDQKEAVTQALADIVWPELFQEVKIRILNNDSSLDFQTGCTDFGAIVSRIQALQPDGICISALPRETGRLLKAIREQGLIQPVMAGSPCVGTAVIDIAGQAAEGFWTSSLFYVDDPRSSVKEFVRPFMDACQNRYPDINCQPEQHSVSTFDLVCCLADIMKRTGVNRDLEDVQLSRDRIREGLATMSRWRGTAGMMAFNDQGDGIRTVFILEVRNGQWQHIL